MTVEPNYDRCYRLLEVDPKDGWQAVRHAYRRKVQAFHPDRAGDDPRDEKIAAQQFEEVTIAFNQLKLFQKRFGDLPPKGLFTQPTAPEAPETTNDPESAKAPKSGGMPATSEATNDNGDAEPSISTIDPVSLGPLVSLTKIQRWILAIAIVTLLAAMLFVAIVVVKESNEYLSIANQTIRVPSLAALSK